MLWCQTNFSVNPIIVHMKWSQAEQPTVFVVTSSSAEIFALLTQFLAALEQLEEYENSVMPKFAIKLLVVPLIFFWCF